MESKREIILTIDDKQGGTTEKFHITPDEAFVLDTLVHMLKRTKPEGRASWEEACKIAAIR